MQKSNVRFSRFKGLPGLELHQRIDTDCAVSRHVHWVFSLSAVDAGVRMYTTKKGKYCVTSGNIFVVNLGDVHSSSVPAGYKCSNKSMRIDPGLLRSINMQITGNLYETISLRQPVIHDMELSRHIFDLHRVMGKSPESLEVECRILDIFSMLYERHSQQGKNPGVFGKEHIRVCRACEYLQDRFNENISLNELADFAGLSPFYLSRVFTQAMGVPPHTYQLQIRLKKATDLLAAGRPIIEVALETGFCDQSHFQKSFKKKFGITPRQYEC